MANTEPKTPIQAAQIIVTYNADNNTGLSIVINPTPAALVATGADATLLVTQAAIKFSDNGVMFLGTPSKVKFVGAGAIPSAMLLFFGEECYQITKTTQIWEIKTNTVGTATTYRMTNAGSLTSNTLWFTFINSLGWTDYQNYSTWYNAIRRAIRDEKEIIDLPTRETAAQRNVREEVRSKRIQSNRESLA